MSFTTRPTLRGYGGAVTSGHYLATWIGARMLAEGGNACDAACGVGFALQVLEPHVNGPAGEVPILVHVAGEDRVYAISGQGAYREGPFDRLRRLAWKYRTPLLLIPRLPGYADSAHHLRGQLKDSARAFKGIRRAYQR